MQPSSLTPVLQRERQPIVDIFRGWALLGVVLMNYVDHYYLGINLKNFKPDIGTGILMGFGIFFFMAKSWTLLSLLFGYGFSMLLQNLRNKGMNSVSFFSRRMFWLFVLAVINSAFFFGDILKDYAVLGMILLPLARLQTRTVFIFSLVILLISPAVGAWISSLNQPNGLERIAGDLSLFSSSNILDVWWFGLKATYKYEVLNLSYLISVHVIMLGCFLLGVATHKSGFLLNLNDNKKIVKRIFWYSLAVVLTMAAIFALIRIFKWNVGKYYAIPGLIILSEMICIASAICWLYISGKLKSFFLAMQIIGRMTLTNYIVQNILAVLLFSGFGLGLSVGGRIGYGYYLLFAFALYVIQVYFSKWWLQHYNFGPIEWIWRQLSYGKRLPIRKKLEADTIEVSASPIAEVIVLP
jgi:uncharacterized protein